MLEKAKEKLSHEFFSIEKREDLTTDEKVQQVIKISSSICAGVAVQPIPFADIFILTPLQALMGERIGSIRGFPLSNKESTDLIKEISGVAGLGLIAQQIALGAYKVGLPGLAGFTTIPLVFGLTYAIGQVVNEYFVRKGRGEQISRKEIKNLFSFYKKQSKTFNAKSHAERFAEDLRESSNLSIRYLKTNVDSATLVGIMINQNTDPDLSDAVLMAFQRYSPEINDWNDVNTHLQGMTETQLQGVTSNVKGILHEMEFVRIENTDGDTITASYFESTNHPGYDVILLDQETGETTEIQLKATENSSYVSDWIDAHDGEIYVTEELATKMEVPSSGLSNQELTAEVELVVDTLLASDPTGDLWTYVPALSLLSVSLVVIELFNRYKLGEISRQQFRSYATKATGLRITKIVILTTLLSLPVVSFPVAVAMVAQLIFNGINLMNGRQKIKDVSSDDLQRPVNQIYQDN